MTKPNTTEELLALGQRALFANYRPAPIVLDHGEGARVVDSEGRSYIDLVAGVAVSSLGHGHPAIEAALARRQGKVLHTSNLYYNEPAIRLAGLLTQHSFADRVFFCQSGAEANEAALKLARRYHFARQEPRSHIVATLGSFHGRTMGALSLTGQSKYHQGFGPLVGDIEHVEFDDLAAMERAVGAGTAAIFVEPIQGEGGVRVPSAGYLSGLRDLCDRHGSLLILDEVQTGVGRTGRFLAAEHEAVQPDICTLAKGLAGGLPLGALLAREEVAEALIPGTHATTFGGNPLSCALGQAVVETVTQPEFLQQVCQRGAWLETRLRQLCDRHEVCVAVRGRGLLFGVQLDRELPGLVDLARKNGVLANVIGGRVVRIAPPLTIDAETLSQAIELLERSIAAAARAVG